MTDSNNTPQKRRPGRPSKTDQGRMSTISVTLPDEQIAWLREAGNASAKLREVISTAMTGDYDPQDLIDARRRHAEQRRRLLQLERIEGLCQWDLNVYDNDPALPESARQKRKLYRDILDQCQAYEASDDFDRDAELIAQYGEG